MYTSRNEICITKCSEMVQVLIQRIIQDNLPDHVLSCRKREKEVEWILDNIISAEKISSCFSACGETKYAKSGPMATPADWIPCKIHLYNLLACYESPAQCNDLSQSVLPHFSFTLRRVMVVLLVIDIRLYRPTVISEKNLIMGISGWCRAVM